MSGQAPPASQQEPLTPVQIEAMLRSCITRLTQAESGLRRARDVETDAEIKYRHAQYRAQLDPKGPTVGRGSGDVTVAERDAWVAQQVEAQWVAYRKAQTLRDSAQDHLRTVRDVTEVLRSLGASVRTAYDLAGHGER